MSDVIHRWFSRLHRVNGVVACGLSVPRQQTISKTWDSQFIETVLNAFWLRLDEMAGLAMPNGETAESLAWTFRNHLVTGVTREDGATFFILRSRDSQITDEPGITRLAHEFRGLRAA
jgi:hypothetical protein